MVLALLDVLPGFHRRRGRAEDDRAASQVGPHDGHVPPMVARGGVLLVAAFVFLIDDDQPELPGRGEDRRARADDHRRMAGADLPPVEGPLCVGQLAVEHGHAGQAFEQALEGLRGQGDFRDQEDRLSAGSDDLPDGPDVDLGLSAAGHAVQDGNREACIESPGQLVEHGLLVGVDLERICLGGR